MSSAAPPPDLTPDLVRGAGAYVDSWWGFRRRHHRLPGMQGAVALRGDVLLSAAHGLADVAAGTPVDDSTVFRVASHSKTFTATVVHQLATEGALGLDDTLGRWLPWTTASADGVARLTLRQLLGHTSGLTRDGADGDHWQLRRPFLDEAALRAVLDDPASLVTAPDVRFKYSNIGYALLGLVVAAASGTSWAEAVRARVVEPLGLTSTAPDLAPGDPLADRVATGYTSLAYADERVPVEQVGTGAMAAATGFCSTATDLVRYLSAHAEGEDGPRLLDPLARRQMQHTWWDVDGTPDEGYGLGMGVTTVGRRRTVGHGGGWPGHITRSLLDPVAGLAVSVLTNAVDGPAVELATGAVRLLDLAASAPAGTEPLAGEALATARAATGRWATLWGVQDVAVLGGRLVLLSPALADPTGSVQELEVLDATTLQVVSGPGYASVGERVLLDRDGDGPARTLRAGSGMTAWRLEDLPLPGRVGLGSLWPAGQEPGGR
ncbi:serine hydrolase domain-containing protein [Aquipuribacter hungaricus]|uniref:Serine hydrolase domain-containing protein n=1 Tax=Aquipuribacter hungaricus TaxID=545624 RepID=A0ABV7WIM4_9MICO